MMINMTAAAIAKGKIAKKMLANFIDVISDNNIHERHFPTNETKSVNRKSKPAFIESMFLYL